MNLQSQLLKFDDSCCHVCTQTDMPVNVRPKCFCKLDPLQPEVWKILQKCYLISIELSLISQLFSHKNFQEMLSSRFFQNCFQSPKEPENLSTSKLKAYTTKLKKKANRKG